MGFAAALDLGALAGALTLPHTKEDSMISRPLAACSACNAHILAVLAVLAIFFFTPAPASAQVANGALVGNVRDASGGAVPGATITATETRTNIVRTAVSNETGNYSFNNLSAGVYRVEGELVGFRKFAREAVEVDVNTTVRVDMQLSIGELAESVLVTGEAPMLQTDRADTGRIIQSEQITQMPL